MSTGNGLHEGFLRASVDHPDRPAVEVAGTTLSFTVLRDFASSLAATLARRSPEGPPLTAVLAQRSEVAYGGVLGTLLRGHGYVPLNPSFPAERTTSMLKRSGARAVVVDRGSLPLLDALLAAAPEPLLVVLPDEPSGDGWAQRWPRHQFAGKADMESGSGWVPPEPDPQAVAYLLFTSGSTGEPKGVGVTHDNAGPFVEAMAERYEVAGTDRFSQTFDLTFDLSVFDLFVAWKRGACVCCPSARALMAPGEFLRRSSPTVWFSVPSLAVLMKRLGLLKPGLYPTLRWSLFCGEALPSEVAQAWSEAAPNSAVENLYGPTEATIACTSYRWEPHTSPPECEHGTVPIGYPFPGVSTVVVDEELREVSPGSTGELLLAGRQVTPGYWNDPTRTAESFLIPPGRTAVHYRTGDRVRRPEPGGPLRYLGRLDNQIKIHGHRVELGEVEAVIRRESLVSDVAAVGWPLTQSGASGIVAFIGAPAIGGEEVDVEEVRARVASRLPPYMLPRRLVILPQLPVNANGKVDRRALLQMLEQKP